MFLNKVTTVNGLPVILNVYAKRKILQKGEIGKEVFKGLADLGLPILRKIVK